MDTAAIQIRLDAMIQPMLDKGLAKPEASLVLQAASDVAVFVSWLKPNSDREYDRSSFFARADTLEARLDEADAFIAALPSREETKLRNFMGALDKVIDLGRTTGVDAEYVSPLLVAMKSLSEKVLTFQPIAAE